MQAATTSNGTKVLTVALDAAAVLASVGRGAPVRVECRAEVRGLRRAAVEFRATAMPAGPAHHDLSLRVHDRHWLAERVFHGRLPGARTLGSPAFLVGMHLPAGEWVFAGKVDLAIEDDIGSQGTYIDPQTCGVTSSASVVGTTRGLFMPGRANLALLSIGRLSARTDVGVRCVDDSQGGALFHPHEVRRVQLTALRAGRLTIVPLD